jgi:hypothetical protein
MTWINDKESSDVDHWSGWNDNVQPEDENVEAMIYHVIEGTAGEKEEMKNIILRTFLFDVQYAQAQNPPQSTSVPMSEEEHFINFIKRKACMKRSRFVQKITLGIMSTIDEEDIMK